MADTFFLDFIIAIVAIIMVITFFGISSRLKKIYYILDYFYQKDKKGEKH